MRTRTTGSVSFIEFHLVVPGRMAVEDAHAICDRTRGTASGPTAAKL